MPPPRIARPSTKRRDLPREGMDARHLDKIRQCPCAVTGAEGAQAHHLLRAEGRGLSRKTADQWAIPLGPIAHRELHDRGDEEAYLMEHGIDGRALARALWSIRHKAAEHYRAVIFAHRQRAALRTRAG